MVSSYSVVNMRPCVFVTVMGHGLILQCCKHETMCVCDYYKSMVLSYIVLNMRPCVFVIVMCHGLILQCCKHETMWDVDGLILQCCKHEILCVCDSHVSMVSSYSDVNMRPRVFMTLWVNRLNFNVVIIRYDSIIACIFASQGWRYASLLREAYRHPWLAKMHISEKRTVTLG